VLKVSTANSICSPVYDIGAKEEKLRDQWKEHYRKQSDKAV
jgi:hypothetical protein